MYACRRYLEKQIVEVRKRVTKAEAPPKKKKGGAAGAPPPPKVCCPSLLYTLHPHNVQRKTHDVIPGASTSTHVTSFCAVMSSHHARSSRFLDVTLCLEEVQG